METVEGEILAWEQLVGELLVEEIQMGFQDVVFLPF